MEKKLSIFSYHNFSINLPSPKIYIFPDITKKDTFWHQILPSLYLVLFTGKPQIIEKTDDSVTLSWIRSNAIGSSSLLGYTVEMFGKNSTDGWIQVANRIQNTTYKITGLTNGVSYYFVVRAENAHGVSGPSQMSEPITTGVVREFFFLKKKSNLCILMEVEKKELKVFSAELQEKKGKEQTIAVHTLHLITFRRTVFFCFHFGSNRREIFQPNTKTED